MTMIAPDSAASRRIAQAQKEFNTQLTEALRRAAREDDDPDSGELAREAVKFLQSRGYAPKSESSAQRTDQLTSFFRRSFRRYVGKDTARLPEHIAWFVTNCVQKYRDAADMNPGIQVTPVALARAVDIDELYDKSLLSMPDETGQITEAEAADTRQVKQACVYVVRVGSVEVFRSSSQVEALDRYVEALRQHPDEAVRFVTPQADPRPVVRGRALARAPGRDR